MKYHMWGEVREGNRVVLNHAEQAIYTYKGIDRTARGLTRVELSVDEEAIGFFLIGDDGKPEDFVVTNPKVSKDTKEALEAAVNPVFLELTSQRLTRGQRTRVDIPSSAILKQIPLAWRSSVRDTIVLEIEYLGLVEFEGVRAAALRTKWRDMLAWSVVEGRMRIDQMDMEGVTFIDLITGLTLMNYLESMAWGQLDDKRATMRIIQKEVLDRVSAGGF